MNLENSDAARTRDRRERFVTLAEARTGRAIKSLQLLGNLANRSNYEYDESDVQQIVRTLELELRALKARFGESTAGRESRFRLKR